MRQRLLLLAALAAALPAPALAQRVEARGGRGEIDAMIEAEAKAQGVPAEFVHRVVKRESNYNPNARGGSALGLMQIKHATARGIGYAGDAAGLYDPRTNLRYGVAYLAGAYRTARGDTNLAYHYYNRGYYYAAKRRGITTEVADLDAPVAPGPTASLGAAIGRALGLRTGATAPVLTASADPDALSAAAGPPTAAVEVPLPPRRPASLSGSVAVAQSAVQPTAQVPPQATAAPDGAAQAEAVEVPLPPRRPSEVLLAAVGRPAGIVSTASRTVPVLEASAAPGQ